MLRGETPKAACAQWHFDEAIASFTAPPRWEFSTRAGRPRTKWLSFHDSMEPLRANTGQPACLDTPPLSRRAARYSVCRFADTKIRLTLASPTLIMAGRRRLYARPQSIYIYQIIITVDCGHTLLAIWWRATYRPEKAGISLYARSDAISFRAAHYVASTYTQWRQMPMVWG